MASIAIADVINTERLPIDAQDIVTKVRLVIAGNVAGPREPYNTRTVDDFTRLGTPDTGHTVTAFPLPAVYEYESSEHATYGVTRSFALPEGVEPFLPPDDASINEPTLVSNFTNPGTPSAIRDGDPATYAELSGAGSFTGQITYNAPATAIGWCIRYSLVTPSFTAPSFRYVMALQRHFSAGPVIHTLVQRDYQLISTDSITSPVDLYAVALHDARGEDENLGSGWSRSNVYTLNIIGDGGTQARIHKFYPLVLNEALLEDIAKSNVRLPASNPQRVTVTGYVPPDREHTIVGWPGGDFTARVAQHQYEHERTIIDFEQAGAPVGLPNEAIEAARERTASVNAVINTAAYSLKMGERQ